MREEPQSPAEPAAAGPVVVLAVRKAIPMPLLPVPLSAAGADRRAALPVRQADALPAVPRKDSARMGEAPTAWPGPSSVSPGARRWVARGDAARRMATVQPASGARLAAEA